MIFDNNLFDAVTTAKQQPICRVQLNKGHRLSRGMTGYWLCNAANFSLGGKQNNIGNPTSNPLAAPSAGSAIGMGTNALGGCLVGVSSVSSFYDTGFDAVGLGVNGATKQTWFMRVFTTVTGSGTVNALAACIGSATGTTVATIGNFGQDNVANEWTIGLTNSVFSPATTPLFNTVVTNIAQPYSIVFAYDGNLTGSQSLQGAAYTTGTGTNQAAITTGATFTLTLGNGTSAQGRTVADSWVGYIFEVGVVAGVAWTQDMAIEWFNDPFCFLEPATPLFQK